MITLRQQKIRVGEGLFTKPPTAENPILRRGSRGGGAPGRARAGPRALRTSHAPRRMDGPGRLRLHALAGVEGRHRLVVAPDRASWLSRSLAPAMQHASCGSRGFTEPRALPPHSRRRARRPPPRLAAGRAGARHPRSVAHRADIDGRQPQAFGCERCVLGGESRVDRRDQEHLQRVVACMRQSGLVRNAVQPRQIGEEDQEHRALLDMFLPAGVGASVALSAASVTATTLQVCRLDEVAADCAPATIASSAPSGRGSGR